VAVVHSISDTILGNGGRDKDVVIHHHHQQQQPTTAVVEPSQDDDDDDDDGRMYRTVPLSDTGR
jgi:hypothetical protein